MVWIYGVGLGLGGWVYGLDSWFGFGGWVERFGFMVWVCGLWFGFGVSVFGGWSHTLDVLGSADLARDGYGFHELAT